MRLEGGNDLVLFASQHVDGRTNYNDQKQLANYVLNVEDASPKKPVAESPEMVLLFTTSVLCHCCCCAALAPSQTVNMKNNHNLAKWPADGQPPRSPYNRNCL